MIWSCGQHDSALGGIEGQHCRKLISCDYIYVSWRCLQNCQSQPPSPPVPRRWNQLLLIDFNRISCHLCHNSLTVKPTISPVVPSIFYGLVFSVLQGMSAAWQTSTNFCPLLGLAYPVPSDLSLNKQFQAAREMFHAALETKGLVLRKTALSISVVHGFGII
jgi:hypothetical protein